MVIVHSIYHIHEAGPLQTPTIVPVCPLSYAPLANLLYIVLLMRLNTQLSPGNPPYQQFCPREILRIGRFYAHSLALDLLYIRTFDLPSSCASGGQTRHTPVQFGDSKKLAVTFNRHSTLTHYTMPRAGPTPNNRAKQNTVAPNATGQAPDVSPETTRELAQEMDYNMKRWLDSSAKEESWTPLRGQRDSDSSMLAAIEGMMQLDIESDQ
ncbi:hypothetical protein Dda_7156 [Drechslerella dactyloides]|uniref:Uncharacterized protein n=1 Tax=Drechslerella dactyloides TaxID=74499 RepID=A0AAD6IXJ8_DREDA|nr:hypothetical protein Dda_7156 [Drechslerella dactyloides]